MLGLAKRIGARFLLTSTSEIYGDPLEHPQKETYWGHVNPIGVRSCYDEGKRTAETLTMDYHRGAEVEVRIARIFNTYGPRMCIDDGRVVSNFVAQALRRHPMTVYGDGKQTRSFQFVSDLCLDGRRGLTRATVEGRRVGAGLQHRIPARKWPALLPIERLRTVTGSGVRAFYLSLSKMGTTMPKSSWKVERLLELEGNGYGGAGCKSGFGVPGCGLPGMVFGRGLRRGMWKETKGLCGGTRRVATGQKKGGGQGICGLVDGLVALMESDHTGPFNLGNPGEFTMLELAEVVRETVDPGATIEFKPNTADDPHMRKPDISKAMEFLNWEPKISLREGLPQMVNDFRKRIFNEPK
ncbi:UDP-glucuronic acid decarboxylase 1 [Platanthera guangdongensis]|uniref:UDP-glucuronate decarboxylase n=1 Tax=Platanthera guangdongensis TaxID=2320717 RepID=A0ABR2MKH8_9ASPA